MWGLRPERVVERSDAVADTAAMPYLIGTDEAGYAPNLGPLVISASLFWVDDLEVADCLYSRLKRVVCKRAAPRQRQADRDCRLQGAVHPGQGIASARTWRAGGAGT